MATVHSTTTLTVKSKYKQTNGPSNSFKTSNQRVQSGNRKTNFSQITPKNGSGQQPSGHNQNGMPCNVATPAGKNTRKNAAKKPQAECARHVNGTAVVAAQGAKPTSSSSLLQALIRTVNEGAQFKTTIKTNAKNGNNKAFLGRVSLKRIRYILGVYFIFLVGVRGRSGENRRQSSVCSFAAW